jgi:hypothetical protein
LRSGLVKARTVAKNVREAFVMFKANNRSYFFLANCYRLLLKGVLFFTPELVINLVNAVRIPGGLTPP